MEWLYKNMNFISIHLVHSIEKILKEKQGQLKHDGLYYFDVPIINDDGVINRLSRWTPYKKGSESSCSWYSLKGGTLIKILNKLKNNEFYIYKKIENRDCKIRLKNV